MADLYFFMIIPCVLSILGCSAFLYLYLKHSSIRLTFGMKHVAFLQFLNLIMALINLIPVYQISDKLPYCYLISLTFIFLLLVQTFWVAVLSNYIYQVVYQGRNKDSIPILRYIILSVVISIPSPILIILFDCVYYINGICTMKCEEIVFYFIVTIKWIIISSSVTYSVYAIYKSIKKLYSDSRGSINHQKWTLARLSVYPFITIICFTPAVINFAIYSYSESNFPLVIISICMVCLIGFFNSLALGFTPEVRQALKIERDIKRQESTILIRLK